METDEHRLTEVHLVSKNCLERLGNLETMLPRVVPDVLLIAGRTFTHYVSHSDGSVTYREAKAVGITNFEALEGVDLRALRKEVDRLSRTIEDEFDRRDEAMRKLQRLGQEAENG